LTGYNYGYTIPDMKTAVSIPDKLFRDAEAVTRSRRISRSALYAMALSEFVQRHRSVGVTARLNEVYSQQDSSLDPVLMKIQNASVREAW
jgi:hypothetical protein